MKRGRLRGPLQGLPYGAKDLLSVAGVVTTWGAKPYAGQVFDYTATVIQKLSGVGAVLAGKLAMVELAGGGGYRFPSASLTGPGLNPWDPTRWSGGSSSGSAAAVAAGFVPFAIGSETSGSIVTPAAYCGVTALRPTYGLVSRYGAMALSWTLDKLGPFAHSAEDCGLVLQVIAGGDSKDPGSAGKSFYYTPQYSRPVKELRIGYAPVDFASRADEAARPAFQTALSVLKDSGAQLRELKLPDFPYGSVLSAILGAEQASIFEPLITSGKVDGLADQMQIAGLKASLELPAKDYLKAMRIRRLIQAEFHKLFSDIDALVAPARTGPATKVEEPLNRPSSGSQPETDRGFGALIPAGNLAGLPALVLPCGFADNLPVALQVVGGRFSENMLLSIGREFQSRTDWHKRRPPNT
jgi:aspartyl-tRNA(Asn)/glutamyl-tRNA(Gln) amidotransferase subunit A